MDIEIKKRDLEGEPVNVITKYKVHTVSLVGVDTGESALGMNITKVKSTNQDQVTEEMKVLKQKVDKAKAKDKAEKEAIEPSEVETNDQLIDKAKAEEIEKQGDSSDIIEKDDSIEKSKSEAEVEDKVEVEVQKGDDAEVEKSKSESELDSEVSGDEVDDGHDPVSKAKSDGESGDEDPESKSEPKEQSVEKAKSFSVEELAESNKEALTLMESLFKRVKEKAPDAEMWEVFDIIRDAMWSVDSILWDQKQDLENKIWDEVWAEVSERVEKSKSLKVTKAEDPVEAMKAFELLNPEMAKIVNSQIEQNKAKALEAEKEANKVKRQKAYDIGADTYKRIGTEDNPTNDIVDALETIKVSSPESYKAVSKALQTASTIINGGILFPDMGSSDENQNMTEAEYVDHKAKSLITKAKSKGEDLELAVARHDVRKSEDYKKLYSK